MTLLAMYSSFHSPGPIIDIKFFLSDFISIYRFDYQPEMFDCTTSFWQLGLFIYISLLEQNTPRKRQV